jgi:hypothetical protein
VFDEVTAIIFIASLSVYDQNIQEDLNQNGMFESLLLFEEICNLKFFRKTPIIIFFNKKDIFQEKIKKVNLNICFKEYKGGLNFKNALKFIQEKYIESDKSRGRQIYIHVTCATDT